MSKGLDTPDTITAEKAKELKTAGYDFVARYFSMSSWKRLTAQEAVGIKTAELYIVSVYEDGPTNVLYMTSSRGTADAQRAIFQAESVGQPRGSAIYATVDYDATASNLVAILRYAEAFHNGIKSAGYEVGWYGSGLVLQAVMSAGFGSKWWLSQSNGFAGYQAFVDSGKATIVQSAAVTENGLNMDGDISNGNAGGWQTILS